MEIAVTAKGLVALLRELGVNNGSVQSLEFIEFMNGHRTRKDEEFVIQLTAEQVDKLRRKITEEELKNRYDK
ncbi:MAG: hypothetical protein ACREHG_02075 [Candidatus Saccharimonadales bacterium]